MTDRAREAATAPTPNVDTGAVLDAKMISDAAAHAYGVAWVDARKHGDVHTAVTLGMIDLICELLPRGSRIVAELEQSARSGRTLHDLQRTRRMGGE